MRYYTLIAEWSHHILTVYVCISTAGSHHTTSLLIVIAEDQQSGCHQDKYTLPMELFHEDHRQARQIPALLLWSHRSCQTTRPNCGAWTTAATIHIRCPRCPQWPQIGNIDTSYPVNTAAALSMAPDSHGGRLKPQHILTLVWPRASHYLPLGTTGYWSQHTARLCCR
jgi:hypothetical protein